MLAFGLLFVTRNFLIHVPNFFSFKGAVYLLPFFLIGIGIFRFKENLLNDKITFFLFALFAGGIVIQQMAWFGYFQQQPKQSLLGMPIGISGVLLLLKLKN